MRIPAISFLCLLYSGFVVSNEQHTEEARQSLKNYGLSHCILKPFNEKSALEKDIGLTAGAFSFMGKGMHTILQNEDTLQVLHDPYKETTDYILTAYNQTSSNSKHLNQKMVFYGCLEVYNSVAFDRFIKTQDRFISN
ncbi:MULTISPECIES: hypothetical protein [Pseudomonas fluorescens group]|jgi:hypothetical protein|uniref:Type VI secretion protein n=1 Tax=Pseudomonas fluorescens TaxID=294 RepID=A0A5E7IKG0_PSEFL|nr:hypothetical protein [Pseudomonas fluorescens]MBU0525588.1 hypothetical protein [Gammaproteobacteria bacterium]MBU0818184.1 hypothetical protein [Gammaproteobacteria bacterium]MBU0839994.1 hypothetical protein [Gammaproteobacteria bacterium]MBU1840842.1 hypothetical protein [Gammaproteobacteria bacterium]VVO76424.1 hypothetical protein PS870_01564 [Pseudomonas fluorescens]